MSLEFDYVIAGAGSAGCVLANRLSAAPYNKVLLIEAGTTNRHLYVHMPGAGQLGLEGWAYADVLPYFKRAEGNATREDYYHRPDGRLHAGPHKTATPSTGCFLKRSAKPVYPPTRILMASVRLAAAFTM